MSDLDLLLAVAGFVVTVLVVTGMVLITPGGQVEAESDDPATAGPGRAAQPRGGRHIPASPPIPLQPQPQSPVDAALNPVNP